MPTFFSIQTDFLHDSYYLSSNSFQRIVVDFFQRYYLKKKLINSFVEKNSNRIDTLKLYTERVKWCRSPNAVETMLIVLHRP